MKRRRLSKAEKQEIQARCEGRCVDCRAPEGPFDYDHETPLWKGGEDHPRNMVIRCRGGCHKAKTAREAKDRAKEKRIKLKAKGGFSHTREFVKGVDGRVKRNPNAKGRIPW
jgi:5-methylcytosine-specific restriction endonuclease McrA